MRSFLVLLVSLPACCVVACLLACLLATTVAWALGQSILRAQRARDLAITRSDLFCLLRCASYLLVFMFVSLDVGFRAG